MARIDSIYINLTGVGQDFNDNENWAIIISDKDSVLFKGFEPTPLQNDDFIINSFTYDRNGNLLYTPVYSDTVYRFSSVCVVEPEYVICQEKSVWRRHDEKISYQEVKKLILENNYTRYGGKFYDMEKYAYFEIGREEDEYVVPISCFWNKQTDMVYAWSSKGWSEYPDIGEIIRQPIAVYGDTFFSTCSPQIPEEYRKNLSPKIKSLLECSKESDNPIVVAYTLK